MVQTVFNEEIRRPNRFDVPLNEVELGSTPAFRARIETILLEDATDGGIGDADSQFPQFTDDAMVALVVVLAITLTI